ncbi:hypothetical protein NF27_EY02380 [Candidatus Jidaibacter acanthamoeba]|uniref:Uncharacterized protein n=1 Tax=Candidatus Jidaibacter acanthamoebae TaxID=86105 RepID=A0A0C1MSU0_9RICK|nr:hypothetical protein [Candidatus Jidaibacter acanthamoeba]KIE05142.1 hypothetical protein NF27_EY02380 [Candidatus Jidaibacter acanthamoeba]
MRNEPSKQIVAKFRIDHKDREFKLALKGRGTSVLGSAQGDHVTAYGLIERGIKRAVEGIIINDNDAMTVDPRPQRSRLYDFLSAISILDGNDRNELYSQVTPFLQSYNSQRFKLTEIRKMEQDLKSEGNNLNSMEAQLAELEGIVQKNPKNSKLKNIQTELSNQLVKQIESYSLRLNRFEEDKDRKLQRNYYLICTTLSDIAEVILTFYNHIPKTTFLRIPGYAPEGNEGTRVQNALNNLSKIEKDLEEYSPNHSLTQHGVGLVADNLWQLFHYPKIKGSGALLEHAEATRKLSRRAIARTNDLDDLILVASRHLHIAFAAFPLIGSCGERELVAKQFTTTLTDSWKINKNISIKLSNKVTNELKDLSNKMSSNHYTSTREHNDHCSSAEGKRSAPNSRKK